MSVIGWWRRRRQAQEEERQQRLSRLIAAYPDDPQDIVALLLSPLPLCLAASEALSRAAERREEEARLRRIIREELETAK